MWELALFVILGIIIDVITGLIYAFFTHNINSTKMRQGGLHKVSEILALVFTAYADYTLVQININIGFSLFNVACTYLICMECISIIENLGKMNPNALPSKITKFFEKIRKEIEE